MPQGYPADQNRMLLLMLLLQAQQQQQQAQARLAQPPQPTTLDQIVDYARKAKGAYDDASNLYNAGSSIYSQIFGPSYNAATQAAWNQAAGEASQAAWNAGANAASGVTPGVPPPASSPNWGGWAAAALSAYQSGKQLLDKNASDEQKAFDAALAVPRAVGAFYTFGLSNLAEGLARSRWGGTMKKVDKFIANNPMSPAFVPMQLSRLWTSDEWKTEGKRLGKLLDKGIYIPEAFQGARYLKRGRRKEELINPYLPKDFVGSTPQYGWTNNKFASSRNEADLRPEDIWGYSAFAEKIPEWFKSYSPQQRLAAAKKILDAKAVNEHHGTIDINWNPQLESDVNQILGRAPAAPTGIAPKAPAPLPPSVVGVTPIPAPGKTSRKGILNKLLPTG